MRSPKRGLDLLVYGDIAIDHFYLVERLPKPETAAEVLEAKRFYGGMGANTAVVAKSLGLEVGLVSVIGVDAEDYKRYLEGLGIRLYLKGVFGDTTKSLFFKSKEGEISFFHKGVMERMNDLEAKRDLIKEARCVYLARTYLNLQRRVARYCGKKLLVYNPGYGVYHFNEVPEDFYRILKNTNVLILNKEELRHLKKLGFALEHSLGPKVFVVTKGKEGCSVVVNGKNFGVRAYPTRVVDPSGAGDAFNAGFIAAVLRGYDWIEAAKIGNATASFVVEQWGCQTRLPSWEEVVRRYSQL